MNRESPRAYPLRLLLVDLGLLLQLFLLPPGVLQLMLEEAELLLQRGNPPRLGSGLLLRSDQAPDLTALLLSLRTQGLLHDVQPLTELSVFLLLRGGGRTHTCRACDTTTPSGPVSSPITVLTILGSKNTYLTQASQDVEHKTHLLVYLVLQLQDLVFHAHIELFEVLHGAGLHFQLPEFFLGPPATHAALQQDDGG